MTDLHSTIESLQEKLIVRDQKIEQLETELKAMIDYSKFLEDKNQHYSDFIDGVKDSVINLAGLFGMIER
jgi:hypothetical protein